MKVVVINGSGGVGKDTFVNEFSGMFPYLYVRSASAIDETARIATLCGWKGQKSERDRKFLYELKCALDNWDDVSMKHMKKIVDQYRGSNIVQVLFLHVRKPSEIERCVREFNATTILITNSRVPPITSNGADSSVFSFNYDYVIRNDDTLDSLREKAARYYDFLCGSFPKEVNPDVIHT